MADVASGILDAGALLLGLFGRGTETQTVSGLPGVCGKVGAEIRAADPPVSIDPNTCKLTGVVITDNGVGADVPKPGAACTSSVRGSPSAPATIRSRPLT